jgi:hypothetical protein
MHHPFLAANTEILHTYRRLIGGLISGGTKILGGLFGSKGKRELELDAREPDPYVSPLSRSKYRDLTCLS